MNVLRIAALLREIADELERGADDAPTATPSKPPRREPPPVSAFVSVEDVVRALGCSRSLAYEHLRQAARRPAGARGLLRVEAKAWEAYAASRFAGELVAPWVAPRRNVRRPSVADHAIPPPIRNTRARPER